jgi:hypothetical protein
MFVSGRTGLSVTGDSDKEVGLHNWEQIRGACSLYLSSPVGFLRGDELRDQLNNYLLFTKLRERVLGLSHGVGGVYIWIKEGCYHLIANMCVVIILNI